MALIFKSRITGPLAVTMAIGVVSMLIFSVGLVNLQRMVHVLADIEGPTLAAAYEMEINIWDYAMAALGYAHRRDPKDRQRAATNEEQFQKVYAEYLRLANTDDARIFVQRLRAEYERFLRVGKSMMAKRDRQQELFTAVMRNFETTSDLLDGERQVRHSPKHAFRQQQHVFRLQKELARLHLLPANDHSNGSALDWNPTYYTAPMFETTLANARRAVLSELPHAARLEQLFDQLREDIAQAMAIEAELQAESHLFSTMHDRLDDLLDSHIQDALNELRAPRLAADRSTRSVVFFATLLMPAFLFAVATVSVINETRLRRLNAELSRQTEDRQRAEQERADLQVALRRSEVLSTLGSIVAGVSHEVRNPLFGISSTVDALEARLKRDRSEGKYARHLQVLRDELVRLSGLMHDLLEYGKPPTLDIAESSVADAVGASVVACDSDARSAGTTIRTAIQPDVDTWPMDRARIEQVLRNLLENAIQHSPGGTVSLDVQHTVCDGAPHLRMQIRDEGPGFDPAELGHVFEPFFTRRYGGTGLGLSIVERIVDAHGGTVRASNCPTGGAEITIDLPRGVRENSRAVIGAA